MLYEVITIAPAEALEELKSHAGSLPQIPGIEDDEMLEFFRRFIPQVPGVPRESHSLGSGSIISADGYIRNNFV